MAPVSEERSPIPFRVAIVILACAFCVWQCWGVYKSIRYSRAQPPYELTPEETKLAEFLEEMMEENRAMKKRSAALHWELKRGMEWWRPELPLLTERFEKLDKSLAENGTKLADAHLRLCRHKRKPGGVAVDAGVRIEVGESEKRDLEQGVEERLIDMEEK